MPNWTTNWIYITGPPDEINALDRLGLSLEKMVPPPVNMTSHEKHNWRKAHWGTKWDYIEPTGYPPYFEKTSPTEIKASFDTAWSPPIEAYTSVSNIMRKCTFSMASSEESAALFCVVKIKKGKITSGVFEALDHNISLRHEQNEEFIWNKLKLISDGKNVRYNMTELTKHFQAVFRQEEEIEV
jgi:hypothetical protein